MRERVYVIVLGPLVVFTLIYFVVALHAPAASLGTSLSPETILAATLYTLLRLTIAYVLAIIVAVPLALATAYNRTLEAILLPVFDVLESIPNLAIFPVILIFFLHFNLLDGAAVVILFLNMLWNIVFALVGGLKVIPKDITDAAHVFGISGFSYLRRVVLPAVFPQLVTGSILAVAEGWNLIVVAEALHAYLPEGSAAQDLFGIGTLLVSTSASGHTGQYLTAFFVMVVAIALINFFVWQKLLRYAERFRFE